MTNKKNQKHENQSKQQPIPQPSAPATPLELSDEELGQVSGGTWNDGGKAAGDTSVGGLPTLTSN